MNTEPGQEERKQPDLPDIFPEQAVSAVDASAAALEAAYQNEQDKRREERFFWIAALSFFIDISLFRDMAWHSTLILFLFQIALLLALANWLGLEQVAVPLERLFNKYLLDRKKS